MTEGVVGDVVLLGAPAVVDFAMTEGVADPEVRRLLRQRTVRRSHDDKKGNAMADCAVCGLGPLTKNETLLLHRFRAMSKRRQAETLELMDEVL